ncbi:MAG: hypothetical protein EA359_09110 [Balneolaceae bacterium]|nr:MAG: hypothetical protein EA359_09110 [Balneolaceae bacterium]
MKIKRAFVLLITVICISHISSGCTAEEAVERVNVPDILIPHAISAEGQPVFDTPNLYVNDYSNALHAIFMIAGNSRSSEYGHENYRPELYPDLMNQGAENWLNLMHITDHFFNKRGRFVNRYLEDASGYVSSEELDLSIYPHLVYAYHMHHRGDRFDDPVLFERLSRETTHYITMPGIFLLSERFDEGRFSHEDSSVDHKSMAYGLAGIHGHGYAWIVWAKPEGEDNMGLITEDALEAWLDFSIDDMLQTYRLIGSVLDEAWVEDSSTYDFGDGTTWYLDAVGAMIRGKKVMYDALYMFGNDSDKELARTTFERAADMFESVADLIRPWGLPNQIEFTPDGSVAASVEVNLYDWYQFLNHMGGGFSFYREREGTSRFITRYRANLAPLFSRIYDNALLGALEYHFNEKNQLVNVVSYEDGSILDDRLTVSTLGMFITTAGNIYTGGEAFARADEWDNVSPAVSERSRFLYDVKFDHIELVEKLLGL